MPREESTAEVYRADDVQDGREVSSLVDYLETYDNKPYAEFNCPSCDYSAPLDEIMQEGGCQCGGCGRRLQLHITSHNEFGEYRNVPEEHQEAYR